MSDVQPPNYPKHITKYECKSYTVSTVFQLSPTGVIHSLAEDTRDISPHSICVRQKTWESNRCVFIYSKVRSCHTCCQMPSDYRDFPKGMVAAMHSQQISNLPWMSGGIQWLRLSYFVPFLLRFGVIFGWYAAATVVFGGYQFALLRNSRFRESRKWSHCAGWWACCGALNGSPVTIQNTPLLQPTLPGQITEIHHQSFTRSKWKFNQRNQTTTR